MKDLNRIISAYYSLVYNNQNPLPTVFEVHISMKYQKQRAKAFLVDKKSEFTHKFLNLFVGPDMTQQEIIDYAEHKSSYVFGPPQENIDSEVGRLVFHKANVFIYRFGNFFEVNGGFCCGENWHLVSSLNILAKRDTKIEEIIEIAASKECWFKNFL